MFASSENIVTEFKSLKKVKSGDSGFKELAITCVGLANAQGGQIIIGIEDKEKTPPKEQEITDEIINHTITKLRSMCFNVGLNIFDKKVHDNGGQYFIVEIYPSLKSIATTSDGKIYIRVGDQCQPARSEDIHRLANEKDAFQWELQPKNVYTQDIRIENIKWFVREIRQSSRVKQQIKELTDTEILEHYNLVLDAQLTNLGVLWLGTASQRSRLAYPITVQYIVYDELENKVRKVEWNDYSQNPKELLIDIEKQAIELTYSDEFPHGLFRKQIRHYDERVIRELLINAIAHKSYTISSDIFINVYTNRIEIKNPGGLPLGVTKDNILHVTIRRNPHLIRVLHDLELMEGEGTGYNLIYEIACRDAKPFPLLISDFNGVNITQYSKILDEETVLLIDFIAKQYVLTQKELIVLGIVGRHKKILSTLLTKELQFSEDRLRSYVGGLIDQHILVSRGIKKGTEYLINPKLINSSKINIKPTLKAISPPRLKALIIEDVELYPISSILDIHKRIEDVDLFDIKKCVYKLSKEGILSTIGGTKNRRYSLAKKI